MATTGIPTKAIHEQWLGLVQPVGLVVAPVVLAKLELVPNQSTAYLAARQRQLEALLQEVERTRRPGAERPAASGGAELRGSGHRSARLGQGRPAAL